MISLIKSLLHKRLLMPLNPLISAVFKALHRLGRQLWWPLAMIWVRIRINVEICIMVRVRSLLV